MNSSELYIECCVGWYDMKIISITIIIGLMNSKEQYEINSQTLQLIYELSESAKDGEVLGQMG